MGEKKIIKRAGVGGCYGGIEKEMFSLLGKMSQEAEKEGREKRPKREEQGVTKENPFFSFSAKI